MTMLLRDLLSTAYRGITVNATRTFLTMIGIIIGVGSVVLMVSIGQSFQGYILDTINAIGTNTIDVFPVGLERFGGNMESLSYDDYEALQRLQNVERVTPVVIVSQKVTVGREESSPLILGAEDVIFGNYGLSIAEGRLLDRSDEQGAKFNVVISAQTAIDLFGNQNPIGRRLQIGDFSFRIIGLLKAQGSLLMQDLDKPVYIPFSVARSITGQRHLTYITLKAIGDPELAVEDIGVVLRERHNIDNPNGEAGRDDFIARSAEQVTGIVTSVTLGLTVFLSLIAGISLLVGGIGIMNIMLVSVTERTQEIGLRKSVGAKRRDILLQFLLEAVALTMLGGIIGILGGLCIGYLLSAIAAKYLGAFHFIPSIGSIVLALLMAVGTGLTFGLYPARRASRLHPMEALRYE